MGDRTKEELKQELEILYRVAQSVHSIDLAKFLSEIVQIIYDVTRADSVLIYTLDKKSKQLILQSSLNPHSQLIRKITIKVGEGITGWVAQHKEPVAISQHAGKDPRFKYFSDLPEDAFEAFLSVPITNKEKTVGVINLQHKSKHLHSDREIQLLSAIGKLIGGAVANALLIEETLELREALEIRKLLDRAKGILMKRKGLSEEKAYQLLRDTSMKGRKSIKEIAEAVILAENLNLK